MFFKCKHQKGLGVAFKLPGGLGSAGLMVGFDDSMGIFQSKWFYDSEEVSISLAEF